MAGLYGLGVEKWAGGRFFEPLPVKLTCVFVAHGVLHFLQLSADQSNSLTAIRGRLLDVFQGGFRRKLVFAPHVAQIKITLLAVDRWVFLAHETGHDAETA